MRPILVRGIFLVCLIYGVAALEDYHQQEIPRCYRTNEEYTECGSPCPATCSSVLDTEPTIFCADLCVPGCFCKQGYVRNRWGNCIPQEKCPCNRPNEQYTCGSACQTTCDALNQDCPIKNIKCNDACFCKNGFARDASGICIPMHKCPGYKQ